MTHAFVVAAARAGQCSISIRPNTFPATGTYLNLAEIQLYTSTAQVPPANISMSLSSTFVYAGVPLSASNCNDNSTASIVGGSVKLCHTADADPYPSITATFPCSFRPTWAVITNRQDSNQARITSFVLDVVRFGAVTKLTPFGAVANSYTVAI
jgi:hypothetical protein